jgi:hypothetical protein
MKFQGRVVADIRTYPLINSNQCDRSDSHDQYLALGCLFNRVTSSLRSSIQLYNSALIVMIVSDRLPLSDDDEILEVLNNNSRFSGSA